MSRRRVSHLEVCLARWTGVRRRIGRRYWWFLPSALLAERAAFSRAVVDRQPDISVTAAAIAARKAAATDGFGSGMMAPYRNVVRMHMLIFFFAFAAIASLDNFAVYATVYAVYFFPWRLVRRDHGGATPVSASPVA